MKNILLWTALVGILCLLWAISIPDIGMIVLLVITILFCLYEHVRCKSTA